MPRGLSAAKPDLKAAIAAAFNQYRDAGLDEHNNPAANVDVLADAIANAVLSFVKSAKVQADVGTGGVLPANFTTLTPVLGVPAGGTVVPNAPGAPILTRPGTGKLT